ncbi:MAG: hypothetical protein FD143_720 [Ignavibacteria bacterium]|nr:MAG: hypothetical protein FD143_720 [Ignavibacteria bacterium]KAF0161333.1 MAG: hypothetical protein FD188_921 [Ignavibacteria bacterium]
MKKLFLLAIIFSISLQAQSHYSEISSMPGAFSRLGFGARGIGMGNAVSSIKEGNIVSYYNPALAAYQEGNSFQTSYTFLSLDRHLNFLNFTRKFEFGKIETPDGTVKPRSIAGVSVGIINAGVSNIDGRDGQGNKTETLSTSENQFFVAVANKFSDKLTIGIAFKFYYYKLYEEVTSNAFGIDIGALYSINDAMTVSLAVADLNTKYKWDTGKIYGSSGLASEDKFPLMKKVGFSYKFNEPRIIASIEYESSNAKAAYLRAGAEYNLFQDLFLRAGVDKVNINNFNIPVRPSFGLSYFYGAGSINFGFDYAFVVEPYSAGDQHVIGINVNF